MSDIVYDVIVVGAGYSGLSASYHLKQQGLNHIVFERGRVGESWRSQRWDAFRLNSTNKLNLLPGMVCESDDPDKFESASTLVASFEKYVITHQLPVHEHSKVISIEKPGDLFHVTVSSNDSIKSYTSRQVLIASGNYTEKKVPSIAKNISKEVKQLHTSEYKNSGQLPSGAVLVVGSAQSGVQITEDLLNAGRKVYLSTSMVARIPRWYRGRDIFDWLIDTKFYDISADEVPDPKMLAMKPPQVSGTGSGRDTLSLQSLAKKGAIILGKMYDADEQNISFQNNAAQHIEFADEFSGKVKKMIDEFISNNNITAPAPHYDEADIPDVDAACASTITSLNLQENNITSIIWTTGFNNDFSYIKLPVFNDEGKLIHKKGVPDVPGLFFLGYPWLLSRKSTILFGIIKDAEFVIDKITDYSKSGFSTGSVMTE